MLKRIIHKSVHLALLDEVMDPKDLPAAIEKSSPEWVIVSLSYDDGIPAWVDGYMADHPSVRFIAMAVDGSKIKMKWLEIHEQELNGPSLNDLLHILENNSYMP
jgi:hypothetical protein